MLDIGFRSRCRRWGKFIRGRPLDPFVCPLKYDVMCMLQGIDGGSRRICPNNFHLLFMMSYFRL